MDFTINKTPFVYALDRFCRNNGLRNPYPEASVFGARLQNDIKVLEKGGWKLISTPGKEPYFKQLKGYNYYKFQHVWVR